MHRGPNLRNPDTECDRQYDGNEWVVSPRHQQSTLYRAAHRAAHATPQTATMKNQAAETRWWMTLNESVRDCKRGEREQTEQTKRFRRAYTMPQNH
jgi:hypothetical protein